MLLTTLRAAALGGVLAFGTPSVPAAQRFLPAEAAAALDRARLPRDSMVALVQEVGASSSRLAWQSQLPVNPASLTKLFTTYAALDLLGPAWSWTTPVWMQGTVQNGVLEGNLVIKGSGDPRLVLERVWLMLRRVQQSGVREIRGDIVLDRSAFSAPEPDPAEFDGEALRPYNVRPDALLLNYKSVVLTFHPEPGRGLAVVTSEPALAGVRVDATVPLASGHCDEWRGALRSDFTDVLRLRFAGSYGAACGEKQWPIAYPDPARYNERMLAGLWREMGGTLGGTAKDGPAPTTTPSFEIVSPPLAEVVRDINKYSNNVMAQQLFLTLGLTQRGQGTPEAAREVLLGWIADRFGKAARGARIDNGSGLSRETRLSAELFGQLLQAAYASGNMPELMSSLPIVGIDGTMRRSKAPAGRAHLKTGSLRDVAGIAGYVLADSGKRYVVVAIVNHANAGAARPAFDALVRWAAGDARPETTGGP
jgi:D-alanyl-D-alanine carboxypeptidase/D-alanyl-D-alanine-endopeptidase (penicillin-binding protein 4)